MTTFITQSNVTDSKKGSIFTLEYSILNNSFDYKFYVDTYNYGLAVIAIDSEVEFDDKYIDVIDKQNGFVSSSAHFSDLKALLHADKSLDLADKMQYIQKHIEEFCNEWGMTYHTTE